MNTNSMDGPIILNNVSLYLKLCELSMKDFRNSYNKCLSYPQYKIQNVNEYIEFKNYQEELEIHKIRVIINTVLIFESFVNDYIFKSKQYCQQYRDTLEHAYLKDKFLLAVKLITGKDYDTKDNEIWNRYKEVISIRNKLVHSNSMNIKRENIPTSGSARKVIKYMKYQEDKMYGNYSYKSTFELENIFQEFIENLKKYDKNFNFPSNYLHK